VDVLVRVAEQAAGKYAVCVDVSKLPEGNFNNALLVTMRDGLQLIVKIPNRNAQPSRNATVSEVVTIAYVRRQYLRRQS
jgi:hypothetical protein